MLKYPKDLELNGQQDPNYLMMCRKWFSNSDKAGIHRFHLKDQSFTQLRIKMITAKCYLCIYEMLIVHLLRNFVQVCLRVRTNQQASCILHSSWRRKTTPPLSMFRSQRSNANDSMNSESIPKLSEWEIWSYQLELVLLIINIFKMVIFSQKPLSLSKNEHVKP